MLADSRFDFCCFFIYIHILFFIIPLCLHLFLVVVPTVRPFLLLLVKVFDYVLILEEVLKKTLHFLSSHMKQTETKKLNRTELSSRYMHTAHQEYNVRYGYLFNLSCLYVYESTKSSYSFLSLGPLALYMYFFLLFYSIFSLITKKNRIQNSIGW
jgi:hypothetical protein